MADWLRAVVTVEPDSRGPIAPRTIPTVRITADEGSGFLRLTLHKDDAEVVRFTVPFLPAGARLTVDGRDGKARAFFEGTERALPAFLGDWDGPALNELDVSRGTWTLAVDQQPGDAAPLLVEVIATPVAGR